MCRFTMCTMCESIRAEGAVSGPVVGGGGGGEAEEKEKEDRFSAKESF